MLCLAEIKAAGHENVNYAGFGVSHEPVIASIQPCRKFLL